MKCNNIGYTQTIFLQSFFLWLKWVNFWFQNRDAVNSPSSKLERFLKKEDKNTLKRTCFVIGLLPFLSLGFFLGFFKNWTRLIAKKIIQPPWENILYGTGGNEGLIPIQGRVFQVTTKLLHITISTLTHQIEWKIIKNIVIDNIWSFW